MSRAFVKEDAGGEEPLPDLPLSPHPNYVTPRGLAALQGRLASAQAALAAAKARPDRTDRLPEKAAERDMRYLSARLASAILTPPPELPTKVAFATRVKVVDEEGHAATWEIVGEDEADAAQFRIAPHSPLGRALIGAEVGDLVEWHRPGSKATLEIVEIQPLSP